MTSRENNASVLLVDDDKDICTVMRSGLQRYGFKVTAVDDSYEAIDEFKQRHYDKIVLDIKMPGLSGFQLANQIWSLEPDAKVCFFSAFEIDETEVKTIFKDLKDVQFIKKPITPNELAKCINEHLRRKE